MKDLLDLDFKDQSRESEINPHSAFRESEDDSPTDLGRSCAARAS